MIRLRMLAVDNAKASASFKTLKGAQKWAAKWVGEHPVFGSYYAVSDDGVCTVIPLEGVTLEALFPPNDEGVLHRMEREVRK